MYKIYLNKTFAIAIPVAMQMMLNMVVNLADTMMIGKLGESAIASVGLGNKIFFVFNLFVFGISSGTGILASQYWGNMDIKSIRKVLGLAIITALSACSIFTFSALLFPGLLMRIFTESPETIALGASYLVIVCISYPFTAITNIFVSTLRAIGEVRLPIFVSVFTISINVCLNYILIFGKFGFPAFGVAGAAIATVTARIFETTATILLLKMTSNPLYCGIGELFGSTGAIKAQFIRTSMPVIANEFMWGLGTTMYSVAYGRMGDSAVAAITIATTLQDMLIVFLFGLAAATAVMLGNEMGAARLDIAEIYGRYSYMLTVATSLIISAVILIIKAPFTSLYNVSPEVYRDIQLCLIVFAVFLPFKAMATVNIVGILRSGGDTRYCFFLDTSGVWLIAVPLAFAGGLVWKLPIYTVYALILSEEVYKTILGYIRYRQKHWLKNLNLELKGDAA